ncbi:MAG: hypothetical protein ACHP7A_06450 [Caulobacterales bacterium]
MDDPRDQQPARPSPSPSPSPEGAAAVSSPGSATDSPSSPPPFIADAGPPFDPEAAAAEPPPAPPREPEAPANLIQWEQDTVEALLMLKGRAMHAGIGVAEHDWRYTELDLAAIAPPLTRIANRYEPVQRLAKHADPLILLFAVGGYGVRSLEERAAVLRLLEPEDTVEIQPADETAINAGVEQVPSPGAAAPTRWATSAQPGAAPAPAPPPRPAEADIDPNAVTWETQG